MCAEGRTMAASDLMVRIPKALTKKGWNSSHVIWTRFRPFYVHRVRLINNSQPSVQSKLLDERSTDIHQVPGCPHGYSRSFCTSSPRELHP